MDLWELRAYVTLTEWEWMHGNLLTSSADEVDLERPKVYEYVRKRAIYYDLYMLIARGSLVTAAYLSV